MERSTAPPTVAARVARADPAGLLYGAIVTAAVLVTAGSHESVGRVVASWAFVLGVYWLTHVYVHAARSQFQGDTRHLLHRGAAAARAEVAVLEGGIPAMAVFVVLATVEVDVSAAKVALYFTVALLAAFGFIGARHAGRSMGAAWGEALGASVLGLLMVLGKTLLH